MQRMIDASPQEINFPSHGIAWGGIDKLQVTLDHRKRERAASLKPFNEGKTEEEMLQTIYEGVDSKLFAPCEKNN